MNASAKLKLSRGEVIERAREVGTRIRPIVELAEQQRRRPAEALNALYASGLTPMMRSRAYGGYECDWMDFIDAVAEIGSVSGSIGWCSGFLIAHQWYIHYYSKRAVDYVFGEDPDPAIVTSFAPFGRARKAPGGYVISGTWAFGSGGDHCRWASVGALVFEDGVPHPVGYKAMLLKPGQFRMKDTWNSVGLKGSGSNDIVVEEAFVEDDFALDMDDATHGRAPGVFYNEGPQFKTPLYSQFAIGLFAPTWAVGRGAMESFLEFNRGRLGTITGAKLSETQALQIRVGEASANLDVAYTVAEKLNAMVFSGKMTEFSLRPPRDLAFAANLVMRTVDSLFTTAGARGLSESQPLQRHWRDVHAMTNHVALSPDHAYQSYGRELMGAPATGPGT
jgi:3-hydroxy-9,10-secoandrosta-1,3,5(10)-triene-9,17-dione monooxygenase